MIEFTEEDDIVKVLLENMEKKVLSLLYFTAKWCGPCQIIAPLIEELSDKLKQKGDYNIDFYKIDIDKNEEFCDKCEIRSVPTFFIMNGKDLLSSCNGANIETIGNMIIKTFNKFNLKNQLKNKIDNEVNNEVNNKINNKINNEVNNEVNDEINNEINSNNIKES